VFSLSNLAVGTHSFTTVFTPTGPITYFLPSQTLAPTVVTITASTFSIATDPPAISIQTQHHASLNVNVASIGSFSGPVQLACVTPLPPVLSCTFGQSQLLLAANGNASTTLKLETDAVSNFYAEAAAPSRTSSGSLIAFAALLPFSLFAFARARWRSQFLLTLVALAALVSFAGCGDKWPDHTPPGTYDIAITATGQAAGQTMVKTAHIALTVTP
jgi:predicted small lipoprotein YifL